MPSKFVSSKKRKLPSSTKGDEEPSTKKRRMKAASKSDRKKGFKPPKIRGSAATKRIDSVKPKDTDILNHDENKKSVKKKKSPKTKGKQNKSKSTKSSKKSGDSKRKKKMKRKDPMDLENGSGTESESKEMEIDENSRVSSQRHKSKKHKNRSNGNGDDHKLEHFAALTVPQKVVHSDPLKLQSVHRLKKALLVLFDAILFDVRFAFIRQFEAKYDDQRWEVLRDSMMNAVATTAKDREIESEVILILKLMDYVWSHRQDGNRLQFRWPIDDDIEDRWTLEMEQISMETVNSTLKALYPQFQGEEVEGVYDLFYGEYLERNQTEIEKGPGFGRALYFKLSTLNPMEFVSDSVWLKSDSMETDSEMEMTAALKILNGGVDPEIPKNVDNVNERDIDREDAMLAVNAMLENERIRSKLNCFMIEFKMENETETKANEEDMALCLMTKQIQSAIDCVDRFVPSQNENLYMISRRKLDGKKVSVFPDIESTDAVTEWMKDNDDHFKFGYAHSGYSELGALDDVKSYFKEKRCDSKDFVVLKLVNLEQFKNWNSWTIVQSESDDKLFRSVIGPALFVPIKKKNIKLKSEGVEIEKETVKVTVFECMAMDHYDAIHRINSVLARDDNE